MRYGNLQLLRFLAAMAVLLGHLRSSIWSLDLALVPDSLIIGPLPETGGIRFARMGVVLFFSLSGFLMQKSLYSERGVGDFAISRFFRIVPLYWFSILSVAALGLAETEVSFGWLLNSLTFTSQFIFGSGPINSVGWTLEYEMFFYVLIAIGLSFRRNPKLRLLVPTILLFVSIVLGLGQIAAYFAVGQLAYFISQRFQRAPREGRERRVWLLIFIGITAFSILHLDGLDPYSLANIPAFACLNVFALVLAVSSRQIKWSAIALLGDASYSIYLWHMPVFALLQGNLGFVNEFVQAVILLGSSMIVAMASWFYFEKPVMRFGERIRERKRPK